MASLPHPSGLDLCPLDQWRLSLDVLLPRLHNGTLARAGGYEVLQANYLQRYSGHKCYHLAASNSSSLVGDKGWPPSRRSSAGRRSPLLIDMGDGTTGTRFLACVVRRLKLPTFHNGGPNKSTKLYTNQIPIATVPDLTAWFDKYGAVLDSPIPYLLDALLATHPANETALFISVRDPWDWVASRRAHHRLAAHWGASTGGCGSNTVLIGTNETTGDEVARDLLVSWSWAMCVATQRDGRPPPIINLFDDDQCASALTLQRAMRRPYIAPALLAHAWGSCGTNLRDACPLWKMGSRRPSRRKLR